MQIKLQCLGGVAGGITGSCYYLTISGKRTTRVLIDVGLIQCGFKDSLFKNQEILKYFRPEDLDFILLTHSHIDHVGRLPLLVKNGFAGKIICTEGTESLLAAMLEDSAKIQMMEAKYLQAKNRKKEKKSTCHKSSLSLGNYDRLKKKKGKLKNQIAPLYNTSDARAVQELIKNGGYPYHEWIHLSHEMSVKLYPSGHVMGGAILVVKIKTKKKEFHLCFTGDLGRRDGIILPPPEFVQEPLDYLIIESTYGGETHPPREQEIERLLDLVRISAKKGKRIIIPSFALERAQEITYLLSYYMQEGMIPKMDIYLDSPLGKKITASFSEGWTNGMFLDQGKLSFNPFSLEENPYFKVITEKKESDALIARSGSYIVVAGSGMCDAGRVRGHLRTNLSNTSTMVFLVGYMTANSLGHQLKSQKKTVKMNNQEIKVLAEVISFDSFSAHADSPFLVDYALKVLSNGPKKLQTVYIVHGEGTSARDLKTELNKKKSNLVNIEIPTLNYEKIIE